MNVENLESYGHLKSYNLLKEKISLILTLTKITTLIKDEYEVDFDVEITSPVDHGDVAEYLEYVWYYISDYFNEIEHKLELDNPVMFLVTCSVTYELSLIDNTIDNIHVNVLECNEIINIKKENNDERD